MDNFKTAREVLRKIFTQFNNNLGLYTTVFVTATYHLISERDFTCSCKPEKQQEACWLHLFLPVLLLWLLLLLLDKGLHRAVGNICRPIFECNKPVTEQQGNSVTDSLLKSAAGQQKKCGKTSERKTKSGVPDTGRACCLVMVSVLHTLSISSIWMAIVFLDGDWWLCCRNDGSDDQAQVACKPRIAHTDDEKYIAADLKSLSKNIGLAVLLGAAIIVALTKIIAGCKCKTRDDELAERIFEEGLDVVLEMKHKAALDQLKSHVQTQLDKKKWMNCSEVVEELIIEMKDSQKKSPWSRKDDGDGGNINKTNESSRSESSNSKETPI